MDIRNAPPMPDQDTYLPDSYAMNAEPYHDLPQTSRCFSLDSITSYSDMNDLEAAVSTVERSQRSRRRQQPGSQHIKHRRTRSGCYTCRQRRIKCDEGRPTCDRCRKGKRECNYPGVPTTASKRSPKSKSKGSPSDDISETSEGEADDVITEESPVTSTSDNGTSAEDARTPTAASTDMSCDTSASADTTPTSTATTTTGVAAYLATPHKFRQDSHQSISPVAAPNSRWLALPPDVRFLLNYHRENLTFHHYSFRYDHSDFLKTKFLQFAMSDDSEALLYAIVAFSAYHYTLACGTTAIANFLTYYDKSIVLLQRALKIKRPDITTLLTVLQLATIEECLGDYMNMLGHQKAAHRIITDLFTPETAALDETSRQIVRWYIRLDIFNGMLFGSDVDLNREWITVCQEVCQLQAQSRPHDIRAKLEEFSSIFQLLAADLCTLKSTQPRNLNDSAATKPDGNELVARAAAYEALLSTVLPERTRIAPPVAVQSWASAAELPSLYEKDFFAINYLLLDFWSVDLMLRHHVQMQSSTQLSGIALKVASMTEAILNSDDALPSSAILGCRGSLCVASYFLPKEKEYTDWARRKFASIEQIGWIYPVTLRQRIMGIWGVQDDGSWLPGQESSTPILAVLRDFIAYRASMPAVNLDASFGGMSVWDLKADGPHTPGISINEICEYTESGKRRPSLARFEHLSEPLKARAFRIWTAQAHSGDQNSVSPRME